MKNKGEQSVKVLSIHASIHLPYLHMSMHNLSAVVITIHEMSFLDRGSILIVINKAAKFFLLYLLIIWWHIFIFLFFVKSFNNAYTSASVQLQPIIPYAFTVNKYLRVHLSFLNMLHTYFLNFFFYLFILAWGLCESCLMQARTLAVIQKKTKLPFTSFTLFFW